VPANQHRLAAVFRFAQSCGRFVVVAVGESSSPSFELLRQGATVHVERWSSFDPSGADEIGLGALGACPTFSKTVYAAPRQLLAFSGESRPASHRRGFRRCGLSDMSGPSFGSSASACDASDRGDQDESQTCGHVNLHLMMFGDILLLRRFTNGASACKTSGGVASLQSECCRCGKPSTRRTPALIAARAVTHARVLVGRAGDGCRTQTTP